MSKTYKQAEREYNASYNEALRCGYDPEYYFFRGYGRRYVTYTFPLAALKDRALLNGGYDTWRRLMDLATLAPGATDGIHVIYKEPVAVISVDVDESSNVGAIVRHFYGRNVTVYRD